LKRHPVSAIIPVKNGSIWLPKLARYLSRELNVSDEIIIIDDASQDDTSQLIQELNFGEASKKLFSNPGIGLVDSLNFGIEKSSKDWIARFDIDDEYVLGRLQEQFTCAPEDAILIFSDFRILINGKKNLGKIPSPVYDFPTKISLVRSQRTAHPIALIKKKALVDAGSYLPDEFPAEDLGLWLRMSSFGSFASAPVELLRYNLRPLSVSFQNYSLIKNISKELISEEYCRNLLSNISSHELLNSFRKYKYLPEGRARQLLFMYDLVSKRIRQQLTFGMKLIVVRISISILFNLNYYPIISKLVVQKFQRKIIRIHKWEF
jgi:glycosyltransferase involved in cell wall biosynthesis